MTQQASDLKISLSGVRKMIAETVKETPGYKTEFILFACLGMLHTTVIAIEYGAFPAFSVVIWVLLTLIAQFFVAAFRGSCASWSRLVDSCQKQTFQALALLDSRQSKPTEH